MNRAQAVQMLLDHGDRSLLLPVLPAEPPDRWAAVAAAAVSLSGRLDDAQTIDDLHDGMEHFVSLWNGGIVTRKALTDEAEMAYLDRWPHCIKGW